jgi:hypothetical protein
VITALEKLKWKFRQPELHNETASKIFYVCYKIVTYYHYIYMRYVHITIIYYNKDEN